MLEPTDKPPWLQLVLATLPVTLAPLVAWLLAQRKETRRKSAVEELHTRAQLVEKLRTLRTNLPPDPSDSLVREVGDIMADLEGLRTTEAARAVALSQSSRLATLFLLYRQKSRKAAVYRALFYIFVGFGILGLFGGLADQSSAASEERYYLLLGVALYIGVGLAFRAAAVRDYVRHSEKDRLARKSGTYEQPG